MPTPPKFGVGLPNGFLRGEINPTLFLQVAEHVIVRFASFNPLHQLARWTKEVLPALRQS